MRLNSSTVVERLTFALGLGALLLIAVPASADAATGHVPLVVGAIPVLGGLVHAAGSVFGSIAGAVLGAFTWTVSLATDFILTTIAALVHLLIPQSWVNKGLEIMRWIVAVPDYGAKITSPSGGQTYGFAGVNELRETFGWIGISTVPLTLIYASSRAMVGEGDPIGVPVLRLLVVAAGMISYPYLWGQAAAVANEVTNIILSVPAVSAGLYKLMEYAVGGVALSGWQLIDLGLMGAVSLELLGLIFMKVVIIILGAFLYVTGPVMLGLIPTRAGADLARAWLSAVIALLSVGIVWSTLFAVGAVMIDDASTAGPLIGGSSDIGSLFGGLLLAVSAVACLWLCLKVTKEAGSVLGMQLGGLMSLRRHMSAGGSSGSHPSRVQASSGRSIRDFGRRVSAAASGAGTELAAVGAGMGPLTHGAMAAGRGARRVGREGLIGTAARAGRSAVSSASPRMASTASRSRAGAVAVRMARAGTAKWQITQTAQQLPQPLRSGAPARASSGTGNRDVTGSGRQPVRGQKDGDGQASTRKRRWVNANAEPGLSGRSRVPSTSSPSPERGARPATAGTGPSPRDGRTRAARPAAAPPNTPADRQPRMQAQAPAPASSPGRSGSPAPKRPTPPVPLPRSSSHRRPRTPPTFDDDSKGTGR